MVLMLALGMQRMAKSNAVVMKLLAVETLVHAQQFAQQNRHINKDGTSVDQNNLTGNGIQNICAV